MRIEPNVDEISAKAEEMYDRNWPGFVHAVRQPGSQDGWYELTFPCGLVCSTNSSPIETELMYNEVFVKREYLRSGIELGDRDTIVDVGANVGMFTMYLLRNLKEPTIHAVEPMPETFEVLRHNVERYTHATVYLHCTALGSVPDASAEIVFYPLLTGNATAHPEIKQLQRSMLSTLFTEEELNFIYAHRRVRVTSTTLASLLQKNAVEKTDLLKIDTEGCELDILGALDPAHWNQIRQVAIEVHEEAVASTRVVELLESNGMKVTVDEASRDPVGTIVVTARRR